MKHLKTYESLIGGRAEGKTLEDLAAAHGVTPEEIRKQLEVGVAVESEHTPDPEVAKEIATDHLAEDPEYYTKLIKAGVVDEPKALKAYRDLYEGDWWDNDPSAPWNQDDREPDESMEIDYPASKQLFDVLHQAGWIGILKGKGPVKGYWVVNLEDVPEEYQLRLEYDEDTVEYEVTSDSVANYATDLYENPEESKSSEDFEDGATLIAPLDTQAAIDTAVSDLETALAPGYREKSPYGFRDDKGRKDALRRAIYFLERLSPNQQ